MEVPDWTAYLKTGSRLYASSEDILGDDFGAQTVDDLPFVPVDTYYELGDVAGDEFWAPFDL